MSETISGRIFLLNEDGDAQRDILVNAGAYEVIGGTFGSLVIDMVANPPKLQGKGNVWIQVENELVRTTRISSGESLSVYMSSDGRQGNGIGSLSCQ